MDDVPSFMRSKLGTINIWYNCLLSNQEGKASFALLSVIFFPWCLALVSMKDSTCNYNPKN
jgi:hypothetical protein